MNPTLKCFSFDAMGSYCEIQIYDTSRVNAKRIIRQLSTEVRRLELKYSRFRNDSLLTEINYSAGEKLGIKIDTETKSLFDHALSCFEQSEGLFDITAGVLNRIWDFKLRPCTCTVGDRSTITPYRLQQIELAKIPTHPTCQDGN